MLKNMPPAREGTPCFPWRLRVLGHVLMTHGTCSGLSLPPRVMPMPLKVRRAFWRPRALRRALMSS